MAALHFSRRAEADLLEIGSYTLQRWGADQTIRYFDKLETCCRGLADHPKLGHACDEIHPGLRRMECGKHVIFYRQQKGGILVLRILHQRMLPGRRVIDETETPRP